jgi:peptide methionine sulfoxide reductase msrA/msrB
MGTKFQILRKLFNEKSIILLAAFALSASGCAQVQPSNDRTNKNEMVNLRKLTKEEERVIVNKGTEMPFTGKYDDFFEKGTYVCKRCGAELYHSSDKFNSHCGWPSFDDAIPGAVKQTPDADGMRTEITCARCGAHLGHVFVGEELTPKNTRYCVNSISMEFIPDSTTMAAKAEVKAEVKAEDMDRMGDMGGKTDTAIVAGGCFWGVEYYMQQAPGVISTEVGYTGGHVKNPGYREVCSHTTGHAEAVRIVFDPSKTTYEDVLKLFFEIHDPTQLDRQGPDMGDQYRSEVFYQNDAQKATAQKLIDILKGKGLKVVTKLEKADTFWKAEDYHQDYYKNNGKMPYCHIYTKRF